MSAAFEPSQTDLTIIQQEDSITIQPFEGASAPDTYLLNEDGSRLLLETGGRIILATSTFDLPTTDLTVID